MPNKYCMKCMPMMNMPYYEDYNDEMLKRMYPPIYYKLYPMICKKCDMLEDKYGAMYIPEEEEMEDICKEIYDNLKDYFEEMDDDSDDSDDDTRRRRYGRRRAMRDFTRVLFIRELRRRKKRRRRRRRRPYYGYWW